MGPRCKVSVKILLLNDTVEKGMQAPDADTHTHHKYTLATTVEEGVQTNPRCRPLNHHILHLLHLRIVGCADKPQMQSQKIRLK